MPLLLALAPPAAAQRVAPVPRELAEVGVSEHLDAQVPLELEFVDGRGKPVKLGELIDGRRPTVLTLNYSNCPMLCSLQLNGLFDALGRMDWTIGQEFDMITVSIDPLETTARAQATKQKYLKMYRREGAAGGYHFLTGREENIRRLADAVGFRYTYSPQTRQYAHAAVTMILTPDGRLARYLYGVQYDPQTLRLSLVEAAEGKAGSTVDRVLLFCFHYDPEEGRYGLAATRLVQFGAALTLVVLGSALWVYRRRERGRLPATVSTAADQPPLPPAPLPQAGEGSNRVPSPSGRGLG